ncbi:DUF1146 domain-containing protein [Neobacillus notoginsengisoli]|uniref:DUF1146 domain-containing protein n=1 Tax=Neobacillus notoginsengisoli TaxID=1578198 RepID=A0A417YR80_9BACI|nr:DUF1146 family protein [Neobacillus notoginsengisoli]RHW37209.1 DUF1146 domain-containing protein [Neobacillus notoginsengisoli]
MVGGFGAEAMVGIFTHLVCIALAWWALEALNFEKLIRANRVLQARVLYILLSIVIGSAVSDFFLDYLLFSRQLPSIFE